MNTSGFHQNVGEGNKSLLASCPGSRERVEEVGEEPGLSTVSGSGCITTHEDKI